MWRGCRYGEYEYEKYEGSGTNARTREDTVYSSRWVGGSRRVSAYDKRDRCDKYSVYGE
jgi:hypothetical protein